MNYSLFENGPMVFFSWSGDEGWPVKYVSSNVERLLGISASKFQNNDVKFSDFIHAGDIERVTAEVAGFINTKTASFKQEYRIQKQNNEVIWIEDFTVIEYENDRPVIINGYLIDSTDKKKSELQNFKLANFDTLTTLPNRQKLIIDMNQNTHYACIIFDIDDFKEINDLFGIHFGDLVLKQVANWFLNLGYQAYRIAGDAFAVLITDALSRDGINSLTINTIARIEKESFELGAERINIRVSAGISDGAEISLTRADIALGIAKKQKRIVCFYDEAHNIEEVYRNNIVMFH
jgi:diguanylate cyclase (GGDEF)-like protein